MEPLPKGKAPLVTIGAPELWQTLQQVRDPNTGWTKTTRAMVVPTVGVLINTCTRGPGFATEALVIVPGVGLRRSADGKTATIIPTV